MSNKLSSAGVLEYNETIVDDSTGRLSFDEAHLDLGYGIDPVAAHKINYHMSKAALASLAEGAARGIIEPNKESRTVDSNRGVDNYFSEEIVKKADEARARAEQAVRAVARQYGALADTNKRYADDVQSSL